MIKKNWNSSKRCSVKSKFPCHSCLPVLLRDNTLFLYLSGYTPAQLFINTTFRKSTPLKTVFDIVILLLLCQLQDLLFLRSCGPPLGHQGNLRKAVEIVWVAESWETWLPLCYKRVLWDWINVNQVGIFFSEKSVELQPLSLHHYPKFSPSLSPSHHHNTYIPK